MIEIGMRQSLGVTEFIIILAAMFAEIHFTVLRVVFFAKSAMKHTSPTER
jgi:hypothetical protein